MVDISTVESAHMGAALLLIVGDVRDRWAMSAYSRESHFCSCGGDRWAMSAYSRSVHDCVYSGVESADEVLGIVFLLYVIAHWAG